MAQVEAVAAGLAIRRTFQDPRWIDKKACEGVDNSIFFLERGQSSAKARKICAGCIVWFECLQFALKFPDTEGIIAGTSMLERRKLRKQRNERLAASNSKQ